MKLRSKSHFHGVQWKKPSKLFNYMKWGWDLKWGWDFEMGLALLHISHTGTKELPNYLITPRLCVDKKKKLTNKLV